MYFSGRSVASLSSSLAPSGKEMLGGMEHCQSVLPMLLVGRRCLDGRHWSTVALDHTGTSRVSALPDGDIAAE